MVFLHKQLKVFNVNKIKNKETYNSKSQVMKAKNLYYVMALCAGAAVCTPANAQDIFVDDAATVTEFTCDNTNHYFANWRDNWFIEIGAGANQTLVERGINSEAMKQVDAAKWTASYSFGFGRWVSPYIGFRFKALGGAMHFSSPLDYNVDPTSSKAFVHFKSVNLQVEMLWDMLNSINYNPNRVFSIIPFFGLGGAASWDFKAAGEDWPPFEGVNNMAADRKIHSKRVQWTLPVSAGIQFRLRLCKYVDFFAEARAQFYGDNWNNYATGKSVDALVSAMGGFNFNIGGRGWNTFNECNYVSQIAALNGQVNDLRAQLLACGQEVANLQAQLPCPAQKECKNAPLMATVRFTINSDAINPLEKVNIYNMAEWLKANPSEKIVLVGYADRNTGNAAYNMGLSERRANAVAKVLTDEYGIDPSRLTVKWDGSDVQPYNNEAQNDWNRIVIFTQE